METGESHPHWESDHVSASLVGAQDPHVDETPHAAPPLAALDRGDRILPGLIRESCERLEDIESVDLSPLLERIGDSRVVLLGEATHGTSEFYLMRARITRELVTRLGFDVVAIEADWPDAAHVDRNVRALADRPELPPFSRFPTWMWRNAEIRDLVAWLRSWNAGVADAARRVAFCGLDLYSLHASMDAVIRYLDRVDPAVADLARLRYGCLSPWESDPHAYGHAAITGLYRSCEGAVVAMLKDLLEKRLELAARDGESFFDASQNARLVTNAESYYRMAYSGRVSSWNLRDAHMFETLHALLSHRGPESKAIVWAHNSHVGDARATEMAARGELDIGQLCRESYGQRAYLVGFGTDHGTVMAAHDWGRSGEVMQVRPAHARSYERPCHDSEVKAFLLPLREPRREDVRDELLDPRLERAIGVVYRPQTEIASHYFQAVLPQQFDEWIWFDETSAVTPL